MIQPETSPSVTTADLAAWGDLTPKFNNSKTLANLQGTRRYTLSLKSNLRAKPIIKTPSVEPMMLHTALVPPSICNSLRPTGQWTGLAFSFVNMHLLFQNGNCVQQLQREVTQLIHSLFQPLRCKQERFYGPTANNTSHDQSACCQFGHTIYKVMHMWTEKRRQQNRCFHCSH